MSKLAGRVALVTGVSRRIGIGASVVERLLADGASVFASGWEPFDDEMPWDSDPGGREALLERVGDARKRLAFEDADFEDPGTPDRLVASTIERFGSIDIVVANHARSSHGSLADVSAEELDRCWAVNARGSLLLGKSLLQRRSAGEGGRLILFTSGQHIGPMDDEIAYAVSKGAIHQMTASLANALVDLGTTVNCINPGPVDTGYAKGRSREIIEQMFPAKRWGEPKDVANLISWLCGDEAGWITGQVLNSEGGFRRWARVDQGR